MQEVWHMFATIQKEQATLLRHHIWLMDGD